MLDSIARRDIASSVFPVEERSTCRRRRRPFGIKQGAKLFLEGDSARGFFEISSGMLRLSRMSIGGQRHVIAFRYPGEIVGFCVDGSHLTDCHAITDATLVRHPADSLDAERADPEVHKKLVDASMLAIEGLQNHCMMFGHKTSREKVAGFLVTMAQRTGQSIGRYVEFDLPMSRTDIADLLGLTIETVSRNLTDLRKAGLIEVDSIHRIILLQPQRLAEVAEGDC